MFVLAYFRERVLGPPSAVGSQSTTNPDQGLYLDEPTPDQIIAVPPQAQKVAPRKAPSKRKATQTQRKISHPRESAQSKRSREQEQQLKEGAARLKVLCEAIVRDVRNNRVDVIEWIRNKNLDNEIAEILPIWTKDCDRHKVRTLPIPLEICVRDKLFAGVKHKTDSTLGFINQVTLETGVSVRGIPRYRLTFDTERARVLFLIHLLDLAVSKYCKGTAGISEPEGSPKV